jgi:hypothetical protein
LRDKIVDNVQKINQYGNFYNFMMD